MPAMGTVDYFASWDTMSAKALGPQRFWGSPAELLQVL